MYKIVPSINPVVFRGYDIRGLVDQELNEDVYYTLGRAYGTYLARRRIQETVVGRDCRLTGPAYSKAFIQGLNDSGINTYDLGMSLSQIVYFGCYEMKTQGSAMITASHNPPEFNGLKLGTGYSATMETKDIQALRQMVEKGQFATGQGHNTERDIYPAYRDYVLKFFSLKKPWKVVIEGCNTGSGAVYPDLLRGAGCEVIEQNCTPDGNFPLGVPDPTEVKVLERLSVGVKAAGADIGFAYDTDGDRIAVVDEKGQIIWMDSIVSLFTQDILDFLPGSPIVYNTLCSRRVTETIAEHGGKPVMWITGHSFIKAKIKEIGAPFGGELSGHIFFMDNFFGHDDGGYASLRLLAYLERKGQTLNQAASQLPSWVSSPEIKFGLADDLKFAFVTEKVQAEFHQYWPTAKYIDIDGIRVELDERMATIRASQNGPYITVKFEGKTEAIYNEMKGILRTILQKYPEVDWSLGVNTHALD